MRKVLGPFAVTTLLASTAVLALAILAPAASAHAAPDPLANAVHVLDDEPEDAFYWYDGYDLDTLHAREAYIPQLNETGIVFRYILYGGSAPGGTADAMAIDLHALSPEGEKTFTITTTDDAEWEGDMEIVVANVTEDPPPWTGVTARMQTFLSYEDLGVAPGGSLEDIRMVSRADDDPRDVAPGGVYLPHSQGEVEVPHESQRLVDSLELEGPHGYIDAQASSTDEGLAVAVENTLDNGQHVSIDLETPDGWNATVNGSAQASLEGGDSVSFPLDVDVGPDALEPLAVDVVTDLGGHQTLYTGVNGTELQTAATASDVDVAPEEPDANESPAPAGVALLGLLAVTALLIRRDRA